MGSLKTIALAGAFTVITSASAFAADLFPQYPMPAPMPVAEEIGGGWYLRGDVGVGALEFEKFEGVNTTAGFPAPTGGYTLEHKSIGDQVFVGAGIGYQFNSWIRFDVTGEYRTAAPFKTVERYKDVGGEGLNFVEGRLSSTVALANLYLDLGTFHGITPFVGAGVGFAHHWVNGVKDFGPNITYTDFGSYGGFGAGYAAEGVSKTNLAWAFHAGLGYTVSPNLKLELAYRYLNMGKANTGAVSCFNQSPCPGTVYSYSDIDSHDIKLAMRWMLGGPVRVAAPVEAPIMRKY